eukprot:PhM_4_TR14816/c0_g1_i1/m.33758
MYSAGATQPIDAIATMMTPECLDEYLIFHGTLRHHHPDTPLYVATTLPCVESGAVPVDANTIYDVSILNGYRNIDRKTMERTPGRRYRTLHEDFMMEKASIMERALKSSASCLLVDCDIAFLEPLPRVPMSACLGLSPHHINANDEAMFGRYNGGWVFATIGSDVPNVWRRATHTSRYFDQAALEDVRTEVAPTAADCFEFPPQHNFGYWRLLQTDDVMATLRKFSVSADSDPECRAIQYDGVPLGSVHTHFAMSAAQNNHTRVFNSLLVRWMRSGPSSSKYGYLLKHLAH